MYIIGIQWYNTILCRMSVILCFSNFFSNFKICSWQFSRISWLLNLHLVHFLWSFYWCEDSHYNLAFVRFNVISYSTLTKSFFNQKRKVVVGVKVSGIKPEHLAQIKIYLPSLKEQQRIVSILDTFESTIANLEAQLAQREKQYEYYRNKLLTFE